MSESFELRLGNHLIGREGWGRVAGAKLCEKLSRQIDALPRSVLVRISMAGVRKLDTSFAAAAIVALIKSNLAVRYFYLADLSDEDVIDNIAGAALGLDVPVAIWNSAVIQMLGPQPSPGHRQALIFALARTRVRAAEFAQAADISIANASTRFKQLWERGYLMRCGGTAASGGSEFIYCRIG